jgi:hypothetical protein
MMRPIVFALACLASASSYGSPSFVFDAQKLFFKEGSGTGTVTVKRISNSNVTDTASYTWDLYTGGGYPSAGHGSGSLTFGPGEASKTFTITIPNDNYFTDGFSGYASIAQSNAFTELFVQDDEPTPALTGSNVSVAEGNSGTTAVTLHYTLSAPFGNLPFVYFQTSGTATKDTDYTVSAMAQPSMYQTSFDVVVNVKGDSVPEPDETLVVTLTVGGLRADATITILSDEYILTPESQQLERGTSGTLDLSSSTPAVGIEHVALSSSDPGVAAVPPSIDIPSGTTSATIPVTAVGPGLATISAKLPPTRGGDVTRANVLVYELSGLTFDRAIVAVDVGAQATVNAHLSPPAPLALAIKNSRPSVAEMPVTFAVDGNGNGSIAVRGLSPGSSDVIVALPAQYGGGTAGFRVDVSKPAGLSISSLSAQSGPAVGNQAVTLFGSNIQGRCSVTFGGVSALNTAAAANGLVSTYTPPHAAGVVDVGIRCGTAAYVLQGAYTYTAAPPRLTSIVPANGAAGGGTIVSASGENLPRGRCGMWFGDTPAATLTNLQTSEMSAIAPAHATGIVAVTLRCGGDVFTLNDAFLYTSDEPLAVFSALNPSSAAPGERVLAGGTRFRADDTIAFGAVSALDMTTAPNEHFITVPDIPSGPVSIALRDGSGRVVSGPPFLVKPPAAPQLTSAPAKVAAGAEVVVNGSGFRPSFSFTIAGVTLARIATASTYAVLRVPKSIPPQTTTLALKDAGGASLATRPVEVTSSGVAVESVWPQCVSTEGGALVTITGSGFAPGAVVTFGIADGTDTVVRDEHTIVVRAPASSGVSDTAITVTNPSLDSGQLTAAFQYRWPESECGKPRRRAAGH